MAQPRVLPKLTCRAPPACDLVLFASHLDVLYISLPDWVLGIIKAPDWEIITTGNPSLAQVCRLSCDCHQRLPALPRDSQNQSVGLFRFRWLDVGRHGGIQEFSDSFCRHRFNFM